MSQHAKDECPSCNGEGIINLSARDFAQIAPLLARGKKTKYPDGEEIQTMARCGTCQGTGIKP